MRYLNIDIETRSGNDIKYGVYKYVDSSDFDILLFAYSIDGAEVQMLDLTKEYSLPLKLVEAIKDPRVTKTAYNAAFERTCLAKYLNTKLEPKGWRDTMIHGMELGLPASLGEMAKVLHVEEQKDTEGKRLIRKFCVPPFADPKDHVDDWKLFKSYCRQDVRTEMAIAAKLEAYPIPNSEWKLWEADQRLNDRGIAIDEELVSGAIALSEKESLASMELLKELTGLDNPNSVAQLKSWMAESGVETKSLNAETVQNLINNPETPEEVREVLQLRAVTSNSSIKKYNMIQNAQTSDGRIHGILQFYGASRTGRWAGRLLQVQNLPRGSLKPKELPPNREFVKARDSEALEMLWGNAQPVLKSLIRTALIPTKGNKFIVSDFSAIEARVIAWLAGEDWILDTFRRGEDIYKATANQMFSLGGVEKVDKAMRQRGKVATLALGYQGASGALIAMGALKMGLKEDELPEIVARWRKANPRIVRLWKLIEEAARHAIQDKRMHSVLLAHNQACVEIQKEGPFLTIKLPSNRKLYYLRPEVKDWKISYQGKNQTSGKFIVLETYGGKLTENIVQAVARDVLAEAMLRIESYGLDVVAHVHDEVIIDTPEAIETTPMNDLKQITSETVNRIMSVSPIWAKGLPLAAAGFESEFYMKD